MEPVLPSLLRRVYLFLVDKAIQHQTTTYEEILLACGLPSQPQQPYLILTPLLAHIHHWCKLHHQPLLTAIVVRKSGPEAGIPGKGFWMLLGADYTLDEKRFVLEIIQEEIFEYWHLD